MNPKNLKKKHRHRPDPRSRLACGPRLRDPSTPELPVRALVEMTDWFLDHALLAAYDDVEDIEKVERVRTYLHASLRGVCAPTPTEADFLTTMALAVAAMESRHGLTGLGDAIAETIDAVTHNPTPTVCGLAGRRIPRIAPHVYCVP